MAVIPISTTTGDPVFRSQASSIDTIRRYTRVAADASLRLNKGERFVSPGDDPSAFGTSARLRSQVQALRTVSSTAQVNVAGLGLAIAGLEAIKTQVDTIKTLVTQSLTASSDEQASLQQEIDAAIKQIDSVAQSTKLGSRGLLNGQSTIVAGNSITSIGKVIAFSTVGQGLSFNQVSGIQRVRVNRLGTGGNTRALRDGRTVLSLTLCFPSFLKASRPSLLMTAGTTTASFAVFRVTGKLGSALIRINSTANSLAGIGGEVVSFNQLAAETGVIISSVTGGTPALTTVGYGADDFVKVELVEKSNSAHTVAVFGGVGGAAAVGETATFYAKAGAIRVNGTRVALGGELGLTARYTSNGYDMEIDMNPRGAGQRALATTTRRINVDLGAGIVGLNGASGRTSEITRYGIGTFTSDELGRGQQTFAVTIASTGARLGATLTANGQTVVGADVLNNLFSGGRLQLSSGRTAEAIKVLDRAASQLVSAQVRLGTLQGDFSDAVSRVDSNVANIDSAISDIVAVDTAQEITTLIQAQLAVSAAGSVLSQANGIQASLFGLLRG